MKISRKNLFPEHKLSPVGTFILHFLEGKEEKMKISNFFAFREHKLTRITQLRIFENKLLRIWPKFAKIAKFSARQNFYEIRFD